MIRTPVMFVVLRSGGHNDCGRVAAHGVCLVNRRVVMADGDLRNLADAVAEGAVKRKRPAAGGQEGSGGQNGSKRTAVSQPLLAWICTLVIMLSARQET